jgi:hypothetical protein
VTLLSQTSDILDLTLENVAAVQYCYGIIQLKLHFESLYSAPKESHMGSRSQGQSMFRVARDDAEHQICDKLKRKLNEFLELENYDWLLVEPKGHASSFITDLIAFLQSIFMSFTNLPVSV